VDFQTASVSERLTALVLRLLGPAAHLPEPFPLDAQLSDIGITSLTLVNLMLAIEIEFDVSIPQTEITPDNFHSVSSMALLVARITPGG
jgi:acyl carrier protein